MALKVAWTEEAEKQLDDVILYLESNWTEREIRNFFKKLESAITKIKSAPDRHKKSQRKEGTYEYQLSPQTTIFYSFNAKEIVVLLLWPNKTNPKKLK